ncbi:unnamed protein product [Amoebophrya sp. A25]|nr:unnamed protein product [Amoebophrya sp. A25]|eukprot:GSA25T00012809001.1
MSEHALEQSGVGGGSAPLLGGSSTSRGADGAAVGNSVAGGGVGVTGGQFFGAGGTRGAAGAVGGSSGALGGSSGAVGGSSAVVGSVVENHSASYLSAAASGSTASAGYEQHTTNYGPRVPSTTTATMAPGQGAVSSSAGVPPSMMPSDAGTSMHAGAYGGGQGVVMTNGASALHHQYPTQQQSTLPPYYSLQPGSSASLSDVYAGGSLTQNDLDPRTMMGWHRREE